MRNYQSVIILKPDLDESQVDQAQEKINSFFKKYEGASHRVDKWGKKRLAYRVKKNKFGYYLNIYHTCNPANIAALEKDYQLFDLIIKYLVIRLDGKEWAREMEKREAEEKAVEDSGESPAPSKEESNESEESSPSNEDDKPSVATEN